MATLSVLVVDDEPLAREKLVTLLEKESEVEILGVCKDGAEAVQAIERFFPDLVFLDVQMPEMDGFDVLEAVPADRMPVIVFVTAYDRYALRAFEVHALDYLLKPFDRQRLQVALKHARELVERQASEDLSRNVSALLEHLRGRRQGIERLAVKSGDRVFFVSPEDIDWIEAAGNYVRLHVGDESHVLRRTMNDLERRLDGRRFLRIHRSAIVNLESVRELQPLPSGEYRVTLRDKTGLTLSRGYRDRASQLLKS